MIATTKPNAELAKALADAVQTKSYENCIDRQMEVVSNMIRQDSFYYRGLNYSRNTYTVAALLASDSNVRALAVEKGIDLRAFDNILGQTQQLILEITNKPAPGKKVATALCKFSGMS